MLPLKLRCFESEERGPGRQSLAPFFASHYDDCALHHWSMGFEQQAATPRRSTLLDAVNTCLSAIGEAPVNTIDDPEVIDAKQALAVVLEIHHSGQFKGWSFNRENARTFLVDTTTGGITLPENIVRWTPDRYQWAHRFQLRGVRVWDTQNTTYTLAPEIESLTADTVSLLPWDEVPEAYNRWATIRGARVFAGRVLGSVDAVRFAGLDEATALNELQILEGEHNRPNILTGGPGMAPFPTYSAGRGVLARRVSGGRLPWL